MKAAIIVPKDSNPDQRESLRRIPVRGVRNLRDLGGYATSDGRRVKWGLLYRSDVLASKNRQTLDVISRMNLSVVVDFRSGEEQLRVPDILPREGRIRQLSLPVLDGPGAMEYEVKQRLREGTLGDIKPSDLFFNSYRQLPVEYLDQYKSFMRVLIDAGGKPVLWHCSAGKDRTGFAAALVLRILGVPMPVIIEDYLLSSIYTIRVKSHMKAAFLVKYGARAYRVMKKLMGIDEAYLLESFAVIDRRYGSFDAFVREGLGLSDSDVLTLKSLLLEDAG